MNNFLKIKNCYFCNNSKVQFEFVYKMNSIKFCDYCFKNEVDLKDFSDKPIHRISQNHCFICKEWFEDTQVTSGVGITIVDMRYSKIRYVTICANCSYKHYNINVVNLDYERD